MRSDTLLSRTRNRYYAKRRPLQSEARPLYTCLRGGTRGIYDFSHFSAAGGKEGEDGKDPKDGKDGKDEKGREAERVRGEGTHEGCPYGLAGLDLIPWLLRARG